MEFSDKKQLANSWPYYRLENLKINVAPKQALPMHRLKKVSQYSGFSLWSSGYLEYNYIQQLVPLQILNLT